MFNLKKPCKDCPFLCGSSTNVSLSEGRIEEIKEDLLNDNSFSCHKTVDYDEVGGIEEQHCAGAMAWLYKRERPNQMMRIGERIGKLNREDYEDVEGIID